MALLFLFLQKATADGFGLRRRGCGGNDKKDYSSKVIQTIRFALLLLQLLASFHLEKRSLARAVGGVEIPAKILSLLLPPNNKKTLKPEAFASSCLCPPS